MTPSRTEFESVSVCFEQSFNNSEAPYGARLSSSSSSVILLNDMFTKLDPLDNTAKNPFSGEPTSSRRPESLQWEFDGWFCHIAYSFIRGCEKHVFSLTSARGRCVELQSCVLGLRCISFQHRQCNSQFAGSSMSSRGFCWPIWSACHL